MDWRIIVGSGNPVKIESVRQAFAEAFGGDLQVEGLEVPSGIPDQPMSDEETLLGARNRALGASLAKPEANCWIGIEGGVHTRDGAMEAFGWVCVVTRSRQSSARSATFPLPPVVARRLLQGEELGPVIDSLFNEHNSKQKGGAVGLLSRQLISREALYFQPLVLALVPFLQENLWRDL